MVDNMSMTIENNTTGYTYTAKGIQSLSPILSQNVTDFTLPEAGPDDTQILALEGQREEVVFNFEIYNDGTDRAGGTYTTTVTTIIEQVDYLRDVIFTASMSDSIKVTDDVFFTSGTDGRITRMPMVVVAGDVNKVSCDVMFLRGTVIS